MSAIASGVAEIEVQHAAGAVLVEPVADVEVLLEVVAQRNVEERAAGRRQLHARGQPSLHDREVAGSEMPVQLGDEPAHLQALVLREACRDRSSGR